MGEALYRAKIGHDLMPMPRLSHNRRTARDNRYFSNRDALALLFRAERESPPLNFPILAQIAISFPNKRRIDIDNACKTVLDALVCGGVIEDDHFIHRLEITIHRGMKEGVVSIELRKWKGGVSGPSLSAKN